MGTLPVMQTLRANDNQVYTVESVGHALTTARYCVTPTTTAAGAGTALVRRLGGGSATKPEPPRYVS